MEVKSKPLFRAGWRRPEAGRPSAGPQTAGRKPQGRCMGVSFFQNGLEPERPVLAIAIATVLGAKGEILDSVELHIE